MTTKEKNAKWREENPEKNAESRAKSYARKRVKNIDEFANEILKQDRG